LPLAQINATKEQLTQFSAALTLALGGMVFQGEMITRQKLNVPDFPRNEY
jgi:hypothetical protein